MHFPSNSSGAPRGRLPRVLAAVVLAVAGTSLLLPAPASANTGGSVVFKPNCSTYNGYYSCDRSSQAWRTNSTDPNTLGSRGAVQGMTAYYAPGCCSPYNTTMNTRTMVYDQRANAGVLRLRMSETYKALGAGGGTLSVGWGIFSYNTTDPSSASSSAVYLSMSRTGQTSISRQTSIGFPHNPSAAKVEQVSNSTIEYAASNVSYRLVSQIPLTDY